MKGLAEFIQKTTRPHLVVAWLYMTFVLIWFEKPLTEAVLAMWGGLGIVMVGWWFYDRYVKGKTA